VLGACLAQRGGARGGGKQGGKNFVPISALNGATAGEGSDERPETRCAPACARLQTGRWPMSAEGNGRTKLSLVLQMMAVGYDYAKPYESFLPAISRDPNQGQQGIDSKSARRPAGGSRSTARRSAPLLAEPRDELSTIQFIPTPRSASSQRGSCSSSSVDRPNPIDYEDPYLTLDIEEVLANGVPDEVLEA